MPLNKNDLGDILDVIEHCVLHALSLLGMFAAFLTIVFLLYWV